MISDMWCSRKGSASALIILMVVLLAVFGALALAGSSSDLRLAARHADWSAEYYRVDAVGERFLAAVSEIVMGTATGRSDRIEALDTDGLLAVECESDDVEIRVSAVVGDPEGQRIRIGFVIPDDGDAVNVTQWAQFQQSFEYGAEPGDLWDGA